MRAGVVRMAHPTWDRGIMLDEEWRCAWRTLRGIEVPCWAGNGRCARRTLRGIEVSSKTSDERCACSLYCYSTGDLCDADAAVITAVAQLNHPVLQDVGRTC